MYNRIRLALATKSKNQLGSLCVGARVHSCLYLHRTCFHNGIKTCSFALLVKTRLWLVVAAAAVVVVRIDHLSVQLVTEQISCV